MKKMDKRLKILLGVLLTIFVILIVVFIVNLRKKEEEPTDNGSYVEPYDREKLMFLSLSSVIVSPAAPMSALPV